MKNKLFILILVLGLLFVSSCKNKENIADNNNQNNIDLNNTDDNSQKNKEDLISSEEDIEINNSDNNNQEQESNLTENQQLEVQQDFKVTYIINDIVWDEILSSEYSHELYKYCLDMNNEYNVLYEIEWYVDENQIDEEYVFENDTVLNGKVVTKFALANSTKKFLYIMYAQYDYVTIPDQYYMKMPNTGTAPIIEVMDLKIDKLSNYSTGMLPDKESIENILYSSSKYYRGEKVEIKKITIYADSMENVISENSFANSSYITEIEIIGDINEICLNAFYNLPNLEKVIIRGNVENINETYFYNCEKLVLEIVE